MVMHYGGYLVDLHQWRSFADNNGLVLIEDAAHAPATGEVGIWGDASAFSFFTNKNMTTAEGGMVLARDASVLKRIRYLRSHGMTTNTLDRYRGHAYSYDVTMLGYNYRMDELRASIGLSQLGRLPEWNSIRRKLTFYYRQFIDEKFPEILIPFKHEDETAAHLMPILLPDGMDRIDIMQHLRENSIQTSIHYPPVHHFSFYKKRFSGVALPETERFSKKELTLPLHPQLTKRDVESVLNELKMAIAAL
jgi:dTDP-4-amino-4,6-dideoxygalactose transaminase